MTIVLTIRGGNLLLATSDEEADVILIDHDNEDTSYFPVTIDKQWVEKVMTVVKLTT